MEGFRVKIAAGARRVRVLVRDLLRPLLPAGARRWIRSIDRRMDPVFVSRFRRQSGYTAPIPPRGLRERVAVEYVSEWPIAVKAAEEPLHEMLARTDRKVEDFGRILDFGCGAGKVIGSLHGRPGIGELAACDTHAESVAWVKANFPRVDARVNGVDPPALWPDGHFDLIWAWSVITHLSADRQREWVAEWVRMLAPGGTLLFTFNSPRQIDRWGWDSGAEDVTSREGVYYRPIDLEGGNEASFFAGNTVAYGDTINTREDVLERLLDGLDVEVVNVAEDAVWGNQDCVVIRKG